MYVAGWSSPLVSFNATDAIAVQAQSEASFKTNKLSSLTFTYYFENKVNCRKKRLFEKGSLLYKREGDFVVRRIFAA